MVTGIAPVVGKTSPFTASATLSDGTKQDVTGQAIWESSNPFVASVSAHGAVSAVAAGEVDLEAAYQNMAGTTHITIQPPGPLTYTISGTVTDASSGGVLPRIIVRLADGPSAGKSATTNDTGSYEINDVSPGPMTLAVSAVSYQTSTKPIVVTGDSRIDIVLSRVMSPNPYTIVKCGGFLPGNTVPSHIAQTMTNIFAKINPIPPVGTEVAFYAVITNWPVIYNGGFSGKTDASGMASGWPSWGITAGLPVGAQLTMRFYFVDQNTFGGPTCEAQFNVVP